MYGDAENLFSFSVKPSVRQYRLSIGAAFPRATPRFDQIDNLYKRSFTTSATYTIPVLPPTCQ